jgi:hypothetical protein
MNDLFVGSSYVAGPPPEVNIVFTDPSRAGETVTVTYSEGGEGAREVHRARLQPRLMPTGSAAGNEGGQREVARWPKSSCECSVRRHLLSAPGESEPRPHRVSVGRSSAAHGKKSGMIPSRTPRTELIRMGWVRLGQVASGIPDSPTARQTGPVGSFRLISPCRGTWRPSSSGSRNSE